MSVHLKRRPLDVITFCRVHRSRRERINRKANQALEAEIISSPVERLLDARSCYITSCSACSGLYSGLLNPSGAHLVSWIFIPNTTAHRLLEPLWRHDFLNNFNKYTITWIRSTFGRSQRFTDSDLRVCQNKTAPALKCVLTQKVCMKYIITFLNEHLRVYKNECVWTVKYITIDNILEEGTRKK